MAQYAPNANKNNQFYYYGMAKAYDSIKLLYAAGKNLTRPSYRRATTRMNWVNPFAIKGVVTKTTPRTASRSTSSRSSGTRAPLIRGPRPASSYKGR